MYKKKHVKEICRFISWGGWCQNQSRMEMSCQAYQLTMKACRTQKVDLNLNQPLPDDGCRLISQNHNMPALFDHDFGGNRKRGCTWCLSIWSPSYHQFQLGLLKYILTSLFHYCSVPCHFLEWLDKQSSPDVPSIELLPDGSSASCPPSNEYDSPNGVHTKGGRKRKRASHAIDIDSRSKLQKFSDWLKTRPSARDHKTASWDVFSRVSIEKAACIVNGFLECQSDHSIPSLLYWAGLISVTKMQGLDFFSRVMSSHNQYFPW